LGKGRIEGEVERKRLADGARKLNNVFSGRENKERGETKKNPGVQT